MLNKKIIKKEVSVLHYLLLTTSKVMIGVGIGLGIASYYLYLQPYWIIILVLGLAILLPTLYILTKIENKEEAKLQKKMKRR